MPPTGAWAFFLIASAQNIDFITCQASKVSKEMTVVSHK